MLDKNKYEDRNMAHKVMRNILGELWVEQALPSMLSLSIKEINGMYQNARDAAIANGNDVSQYPRRIRWRTNGLHSIGDHL